MEEEEDKNKKFKNKDKIIFKNIMKERVIYNNHLYRKIDNNYDSNRNNNNNNQINHMNQILNNKEKEKEKNILLSNNKQKNIFLNNNTNKYNHINRIINLKSLNGHNNNNNNNMSNNINNNINNKISNNLNVVKDSFFTKYNKMGINQNNKQMKDPYKKEQKCISAFDSMLTNNKNNSEELVNNLQNVNMSIVFNQKKNIKNNNLNDDTPSVSTLAYSKKYNSNSINNQNLTEDHNNKFRMGLLSAFPNSNNNNIIIPIIPLQRPLSNFNLGCGQLWENIDNINKNNINKLEQSNKKITDKKIVNNVNILDKNRLTNNMRHKISTAPSQKRGEYNYFSNNDKDFHMINKNYSNIFNNINNLGPKLHHIKIDRSLMNNKLTDSLN